MGSKGAMHATAPTTATTSTATTVEALLTRYPRDGSTRYEYGTAGFRMHADRMPAVALRVGLFLASLAGGEALGVVLTASHNPVEDNGIKLVASSGEMMEGVEGELARVCNMEDPELLAWAQKGIQVSCGPRVVLVGRDTRPSGEALFQALSAGLQPNCTPIDCGLVTTPQLHHYVRSFNQRPGCSVAMAEALYLEMLSTAFCRLDHTTRAMGPQELHVDCANGVGALTMRRLMERGPLGSLQVTLKNCGEGQGELNRDCGADYVKLYQRAPEGLTASTDPSRHYASFDGDADRVVFFYFDDPAGTFHLLDGDRIAALLAETFKALIDSAGIQARIGVVQTAYANGASTAHLRALGVETRMTCTGVKNLHHEAKSFDVGIYFEANGHGTVLFSPAFRQAVAARQPQGTSTLLPDLMALVNECVGDAISDLLLVEAILATRHLTLAQWASAYTELPSLQLKVPVGDRARFRTTNADQQLVEPEGLQAQVDRLVAAVPGARAFVRPSGTEDIVRVYAEATDRTAAERLAHAIKDLIS